MEGNTLASTAMTARRSMVRATRMDAPANVAASPGCMDGKVRWAMAGNCMREPSPLELPTGASARTLAPKRAGLLHAPQS